MSIKVIMRTERGEIALPSSSLFLEVIDGADSAPKQNVLTRSPRQDGASRTSDHYESRYMTFQGTIKVNQADFIASKRREIQYLLSGGEINIEYIDKTGSYFIDAYLDGDGISYPARQGSNQRFLINTVSPDPFWRSESIVTEPTFEPLFEFEFIDEGEEEGSFEMGIQRDERVIINNGDVPSPVVIEFYGPAENPKIENVTAGEFLKVNQTLGSNEYMRIDTAFGRKSVMFIDQDDGTERDVMNWIDPESQFWILQDGENEIIYTADSDIQGAVVEIYYYERFVGV